MVDRKKKSKLSVTDAAVKVLREKRQPMHLKELITEALASMGKQFSGKLSHYYTEINMDGRFMHMGKSSWGLKDWVPKEHRKSKSVNGATGLSETDYQPNLEDYAWDEAHEEDAADDDEKELLVPASEEDEELDLDAEDFPDDEVEEELGCIEEDDDDDDDPLH